MPFESSISRKLTWLNVLVSATALAIATFALLIYDQSSYRKILFENMSAQADVVGKNSVSSLVFADPETARTTLSALERVPNILAASLFTADGRLFASYSQSPNLRITKISSSAGPPPDTVFENQVLRLTRRLESGKKVVGYLVIEADTSGVQARLRSYLLIIGAVFALSLLAAIALSSAFRRSVAQPIIELAESARAVSRDRDYSVRVPAIESGDELSVLVDAFNKMLAAIQIRDVALDSERARLRAVLENAPVGIMVVDAATNRIILANRTLDELLQESTGGLDRSWGERQIMRANRELVEREQRPLARALRGERVPSDEYLLMRRDGSETWVRASAAPVLEKDGQVAAGLLVVIGIDDQKRAQEALLQAEKLAAAGRLAASISHEINNPLESVTNLLFIALSQPDLSDDVRKLLTMADQELARVTHIATQTLRFYRQSTNPTSADMGALIDSVLQLLSGKIRNKEIQVERRFNTRHRVLCFEGELRQVFTNLISNAIDAMPASGGRLVVETKEIGNLDHDLGPGLQVTVADNGNGIPAEVRSRIFEPFYTTKGTRGTGLGLWVSREIVSKHNGLIRVRSKLGCGTVFMLYIPFNGATRAAADSQVAKLA